MAVTTTTLVCRIQPGDATDYKTNLVDVVLSNSYTASGEALTPAQLSLVSRITDVQIVQQPANGYTVIWDGSKLRVFRTGAAVASVLQEAPGATDVSGTYRLRVGGV